MSFFPQVISMWANVMRKDKLRRRKSLTQVHNCKRIIYYNFLLYRNSMRSRSQLNLCCPTRARRRRRRALITIALIARGDKVSTHLRVMSCCVGKTIAPIVYADLVEPALYPWCESVVAERCFTVDNSEILTHCEASQISRWIMFEDTLICPLLGCGCQFIVPGLRDRDLRLIMGNKANTPLTHTYHFLHILRLRLSVDQTESHTSPQSIVCLQNGYFLRLRYPSRYEIINFDIVHNHT